jgi:hypothetical protein
VNAGDRALVLAAPGQPTSTPIGAGRRRVALISELCTRSIAKLAEARHVIELSFLKILSNSVAHMLAFTPEAIGWISAARVGLLFLGMLGRLAAVL